MNNYCFNINSGFVEEKITNSLKNLLNNDDFVVVCIGTDLAIGDSLGPYTGSLLVNDKDNKIVVYGTLDYPITAKETETLTKTIKKIHPHSKILAIDAAVGNREDIGNVKVLNVPIKPGLGVNKNLSEIGDISIIGIVSDKNQAVNKIINDTRLSLVVKMAKTIKNSVQKCAVN
ncbi:MAG: spore protease YyaC [Clostridia bacterium]|nr:spore protease YyaC [Clostridia bacterium]